MSTLVGLDLSLCKTGYTILSDNRLHSSGIIKSKPSGESHVDELRRIIKIVEEIQNEILYIDGKIDLVAIENLAFSVRNTTALTQLAGLSYLVRKMLHENGVPFVLVAPTSVKKFVCGKGNADKNLIMMEIFKQYDHTALDDNEADSYALAAIAGAVIDCPLRKLTVPQSEVVELIKKQLCQPPSPLQKKPRSTQK